jgi:hypothetical protein
MGKSWGILQLTAGDLEVRDLFQEQLFPGSDHIHRKPFPNNPEASYLRPTPYGEIVDIQLSDAPAEVLSCYPVLLLAGDHQFDGPFLASLASATENGCRLLLGQRHADALGTARVNQLSATGRVELLDRWVNPVTDRPAAISHARLATLSQNYLPVLVRGDPVLFQCNRTRSGWVIELVNNHGVVKFPTKPAVIDKRAVASVALSPRLAGQELVDWATGEILETVGGLATIQIAPGSTRFVEMRPSLAR